MANGYAKAGGVLVPCERTDYTTCLGCSGDWPRDISE